MAKEIAFSKRAKISEAQQHIILASLAASVLLGVAISLIAHFVKQIYFNMDVIAAEEQSIAEYSKVIQDIGICEKPKGSIYSDDELKNCNPDSIEVSEVPGTLRSNIIEDVASNEALNSVPKEDSLGCINPNTNKNYTYKELNEIYNKANGSVALNNATQLIKTCSALRIIPDALPSEKNEEALLASLNKLFKDANWEPETLSPTGEVEALGGGLNSISVKLSVEANSATTHKVLNNIERSIREFNITRATIEWGNSDTLIFNAQANAYYMDKSAISETTKTINPGGKK